MLFLADTADKKFFNFEVVKLKSATKSYHCSIQSHKRIALRLKPETFETERLAEMGLGTTRCGGRQIFGGANDFCPNLLKLTRKICLSKMINTFRAGSRYICTSILA